MKKIFLSVPMKDRTKENIEKSIEKMKKFASLIFEGEEIEFIDSIVKEKPPKDSHESVWFLGESIKLLSKANVLITVNFPFWYREPKGILCEHYVFTQYLRNFKEDNLFSLDLNYIMDKEEINYLREKYAKKEISNYEEY